MASSMQHQQKKLSNLGEVFSVAKQNQVANGTVVKEGPFYYAFKNPKDLSVECKLHVPGFNMHEWVRRRTPAEKNKMPEFMGSSNIILAPTGYGKTIFSTQLIANFIRYNKQERIAIVLCANSRNAYDRLIAANAIAQKPFLLKEQICYLQKLEPVCELFKKISDMAQSLEHAATGWQDDGDHLEDEQEKQNIADYKAKEKRKIATILNNYTHYIFYFDDCNQYYKDPKTRPFWDLISSQNRHAGVTVIYNMQDISYVPQTIRTNISSLFIIGSLQQAKFVQKNLSGMFPPPYSSSEKKFIQFQTQLRRLFPAKQAIFVFSSFYINAPAPKIFVYKVNKEFVDALLSKETEIVAACEKKLKKLRMAKHQEALAAATTGTQQKS